MFVLCSGVSTSKVSPHLTIMEKNGKLCYLEAPEEPEEADSTLGEEARVMSVQGMTPNDFKHCKR